MHRPEPNRCHAVGKRTDRFDVHCSSAAIRIDGQVQASGSPVAGSTVTLWAASAGEPRRLAQSRSGADGRFSLRTDATPGNDITLYLVAKGGEATIGKGGGDNPAIALLAVLGNKSPARATINEMTTVASVWTHAQFLDGTAIKGHALGLRIAAGNVPSFVDLQTGGWGTTIQDPLNSGQTPTMANFATLANALSGCATRVIPDACSKLYTVAAPPTQNLALRSGAAPTDTLTAAESIAKYPWYQTGRAFSLLEAFYPIPQGKTMRPVPYMPYLSVSPSAWVLPLKFDGGGYREGGKAMFDSVGNLWVGDNFTVGWQSRCCGRTARNIPDRRSRAAASPARGPLSSTATTTSGFRTSQWASSPIVQFCGVRTENCPPGMKTGDQISPPGGYVGGGLQMQSDIAIGPAGDVWVMNNWQNVDSCFSGEDEALSTRCGGQDVVIGGCASSTRSGDVRSGPIHSRTFMGTSSSYACAGLGTTCRG